MHKPGQKGAFRPTNSLDAKAGKQARRFSERDNFEHLSEKMDPPKSRLPGIGASPRPPDARSREPGRTYRPSIGAVSGASEYNSLENMMSGKTNRIEKSTQAPGAANRAIGESSIPRKREQTPSGVSDEPSAKRQRSPRRYAFTYRRHDQESNVEPGTGETRRSARRSISSAASKESPNAIRSTASHENRPVVESKPNVKIKLKSFRTNNSKVTDSQLCMAGHADEGVLVFYWSKDQRDVIHKDKINNMLFAPEQCCLVHFEGQRKGGENKKWWLEFNTPRDAMKLVDFIKSHFLGIKPVEKPS
jgi:hypothetical protein